MYINYNVYYFRKEDCSFDKAVILSPSIISYIKDLLKFRKQEVLQYGRISVNGYEMQGRVIREKIEKGEVAFRSGDRLIVNLEIEQVFNEAANTFINDSYRITKVLQHIPRTGIEQQNLDFEK